MSSSLSVYGMSRLGASLAVLDFTSFGSAMSLRNFVRLGSSLSVFGMARYSSSLAVLDFLNLGSTLSVRSMARLPGGRHGVRRHGRAGQMFT